MARKHKNRDRDGSTPSLERDFLAPVKPAIPVTLKPAPLAQLMDRRRFSFAPEKPPHDVFRGKIAKVTRAPSPRKAGPKTARKAVPQFAGFAPEAERFARPRSTDLCSRRRSRKQVLFAKRLTGKGARSKKHFNTWSKVYC